MSLYFTGCREKVSTFRVEGTRSPEKEGSKMTPEDPCLFVLTPLCNPFPSSVSCTSGFTANKQNTAEVMGTLSHSQTYLGKSAAMS